MAKYYNGNITFGLMFAPDGAQPIDDRSVVEQLADLTGSTTFASGSKIYNGMPVYVKEEKAIYVAIDSSNYNDLKKGWKKVGSADTLTASTYTNAVALATTDTVGQTILVTTEETVGEGESAKTYKAGLYYVSAAGTIAYLSTASAEGKDFQSQIDAINALIGSKAVSEQISDAIDALSGSAEDTESGIKVAVGSNNGEVDSVEINIEAAAVTYTEKTETEAAKLTASNSNVLNGDAISAISEYVDAVVEDATADVDDLREDVDTVSGDVEDLQEQVADDEAKLAAMEDTKADKDDLVWSKASSTSIARNTKNQKVAEINDNGELYLYVEGEYMNINDLLGQLAHETYDDASSYDDKVVVSNPTEASQITGIDTAKQIIVSGDLNNAAQADGHIEISTGSTIVVNLASASDYISAKSAGNITLNDCAIAASKSLVTAMNIATDGAIVVSGGSASATSMDEGVLVGSSNAPTSVLIKDFKFESPITIGALISTIKDGSTITIQNCHFASVGTILSNSNGRDGASSMVTINIVDCEIDKFTGTEYIKLTDGTNVFNAANTTINFKNLVVAGKKVDASATNLLKVENHDESTALPTVNVE